MGESYQKPAFDYMLTYSPYDNVAAKAYPAILVQTSFDDSQVMYWEPSKYVAKLRANKTDKNPLIFFINMHGGHGGSSGRYDRIREADRRLCLSADATRYHTVISATTGEPFSLGVNLS